MRLRVRDVPWASWIMARAFGHGPIRGVLALLMALIMVLVYCLRRGAYMTEGRDAVVFFSRHRPVVDAALSLVVILVGTVTLSLLAVTVQPITFTGSTVLQTGPLVWLFLGAGVFALSGGAMTMPVGSETPHGERWAFSGLAQLPGTRMSGLLLARSLTEHAPAGAVIVAVAATDDHLRAYQALGYTEGKSRRVYRVT